MDLEIPTNHFDDRWMRCGETFDYDYPYVGKWYVRLDDLHKDSEDMTCHDRAWFKCKKALERGKFWKVVASTSPKPEFGPGGLLMVVTKDYNNLKDLEIVAECMLEVLQEELKQGSRLIYKTGPAESGGKVIYYYSESEGLIPQ